MYRHEQSNSSSITTIKISSHSRSRFSFVRAVEGVQLPSPFLLGSNAPANAAAPASPIWLSAVSKAKHRLVSGGERHQHKNTMHDWARKDIMYGNEHQNQNYVALCVIFGTIAPSTNHVRHFVGQWTHL
jgi:hypothetical protein